jgi:hypothetical protein
MQRTDTARQIERNMRKIWNEGKACTYIRGQPIAIIEQFQVCKVPEQRRYKVNHAMGEERP